MRSGLPSASNIVSAIRGIRLPAKTDDLVDQAKRNEADEDILVVLARLPAGDYNSAADIVQGVSKVNKALKAMVPSISASEVARTVAGIDFPADKATVIEQARKNGASDSVINVFKNMDREEFRNVVDIGRGIREAKEHIRRDAHHKILEEHEHTEEHKEKKNQKRELAKR